MPSSGYVADTFVAGEQPTTAKWNELWGNDASFNSGAGFNDGIIVARHLAPGAVTAAAIGNYNVPYQKDNANTVSNTTASTNVTIQAGWGQVIGNNTATVSDTVTFPTAFSTVLGVVVAPLSAHGSSTAASDITNFDTNFSGGTTAIAANAFAIGTTSFSSTLTRNAGTFANTLYWGYSWIAWGV